MINDQAHNENSISSIERYIEVLIESFPNGLTQRELAKRANVSPSAVSKIKERLFPLCEIEKLAFDSRLVLKPNFQVFRTVIEEQIKEQKLLNVLRLISTEYGERVINVFDIHGYLVSRVPIYGFLFNEKETKLMTTIILRYIRSLGIPLAKEKEFEGIIGSIRKYGFDDSQSEGFLLGILLSLKLTQLAVDWPVESEEELRILVGLRDKIFYMLKHALSNFTINLSIYKSLKKQEKEEYNAVCEKVINYYLRKIFTAFTESLEKAMTHKKISFDQRYKEIGLFAKEKAIQENLKILKES